MLIFEQLVGRGFMVLDPVRKVLVFNREVVGKFPAIREAKMEEFRWLVGEWSAMNKVRATPSTPAYTDTYFYSYQLCEADTRISITGVTPARSASSSLARTCRATSTLRTSPSRSACASRSPTSSWRRAARAAPCCCTL